MNVLMLIALFRMYTVVRCMCQLEDISQRYVRASDMVSNPILQTLARCEFGETFPLAVSPCMSHCSVRDRCLAVMATMNTCRMCHQTIHTAQAYNESDLENIYIKLGYEPVATTESVTTEIQPTTEEQQTTEAGVMTTVQPHVTTELACTSRPPSPTFSGPAYGSCSQCVDFYVNNESGVEVDVLHLRHTGQTSSEVTLSHNNDWSTEDFDRYSRVYAREKDSNPEVIMAIVHTEGGTTNCYADLVSGNNHLTVIAT